jgi:hypothetical protein
MRPKVSLAFADHRILVHIVFVLSVRFFQIASFGSYYCNLS